MVELAKKEKICSYGSKVWEIKTIYPMGYWVGG